MKIVLRFKPFYNGDKFVKPEDSVDFIQALEVPEGITAQEILKKIGADKLVEWDMAGRKVIGGYFSEGKLSDGKTYSVIGDVRVLLKVFKKKIKF